MADLIDRLSGESEYLDPPRPKLPIEQFCARFRLFLSSKITAAEAIQDFDLQGDELNQAVSIRNVANGKSGVAAKLAYMGDVQAIAQLLELISDRVYHDANGAVLKAAVLTDLEI